MIIVHVSMNYMQGFNYQENLLTKAMSDDGHEVIIIAPNRLHRIYKNVEIDKELINQQYTKDNLVHVIRERIVFIGKYLYAMPDLYKLLEKHKPDVILVHGIQQLPLLTAVKYAKKNPNITLYVDNHADHNNSARNILSKYILHGLIYKAIIKSAYPSITKLLYISYESKQFLTDLYRLPEDKMEFYPLGGTIIDGAEREKKRAQKRTELGLSDTDIMLCHSGRLDKLKRTADILDALYSVKDDRLKLFILGSIEDDVKGEVISKIKRDLRVTFLGWKNGDELLDYLCATDLYCQPGSQSATLQNAICCGSPVMLYPHVSHEPYLMENGFYVKTVEDMVDVFRKISDEPSILKSMSEKSYEVAHQLLDYRKLAARLYE